MLWKSVIISNVYFQYIVIFSNKRFAVLGSPCEIYTGATRSNTLLWDGRPCELRQLSVICYYSSLASS